MRQAAIVLALLPVAALAGCTSDLSSSNFELRASEIGWRVGQDAVFLLRFNPDGADQREYEVDAVFAISEVRFEKDGINVFGDYETKRAADVALTLLKDGSPVPSAKLNPSEHTVQVRVKIPESLENGEYQMELKLFKVGWVESDLFRVAV